jgi:hypothetical protein
LECAAIQDVLVVGKALDQAESRERKIELDRIAAMLSRLGGRGYCVKEESSVYGSEGIDFDFDSDFDFDPDSDFDLDEPEFQQLNRTVAPLALHFRRLVETFGEREIPEFLP